MQQEDVHEVRLQPFQAAVDPLQDGVPAQVIMRVQPAFVQPDAALGLQPDPAAQAGRSGKHFTEDGLGFAAAVDIRMIEQRDPCSQGGLDGGSGLVHMVGACGSSDQLPPRPMQP